MHTVCVPGSLAFAAGTLTEYLLDPESTANVSGCVVQVKASKQYFYFLGLLEKASSQMNSGGCGEGLPCLNLATGMVAGLPAPIPQIRNSTSELLFLILLFPGKSCC